MIEYRTVGYIALALITIYIALRMFGQHAINKLVKAELDHVVHSDKYKVKGRYE